MGFLDYLYDDYPEGEWYRRALLDWDSPDRWDPWSIVSRFLRGMGEGSGKGSQSPSSPASVSSSPPVSPSSYSTSSVKIDQEKVSEINPGVARWVPEVQKVSEETGVPAEVILAIMDIESDGRPDARSVAGAVGLMQVMPQYHAHRAEKYGGSLEDPAVNLRVGAEILKENFQRIKAKNPNLPDDQAWALAAVAYFGALDWNSLQITGARDAYGTSGFKYHDLFVGLRDQYRQALSPLSQPLGQGPYQVSAWTGGQSYPLTQGYGQTEFARTSGFYKNNFHPGIDIGAPYGTKITAPFGAKVVQAGLNGGYGYSVTLEVQVEGKTYHVLIGHLAEPPYVSPGQVVQPGQVLGIVGSTGYSTGPHIHLEVREGGVPVDPRALFVY